jgi:NADPH-dependent 2,4-dienoyl-CoA reductase/sulfur reductase-like enzyme
VDYDVIIISSPLEETMSIDYTQKSYWLNTYGPYSPNAPVHGDISVDVAIIGGGFTGLSTAYFLRKAEPALKVAVLEPVGAMAVLP